MYVEIKKRLNYGNAFYHSVHNVLFSHLLSKTTKVKVHTNVALFLVCVNANLASHF
jgi:hypothetical protein